MRVYKNVEFNRQYMEEKFEGCGDFVRREFPLGKSSVFVAYFDGMSDKKWLDFIMLPQLAEAGAVEGDIFDYIKEKILTTADMRLEEDFDAAIVSMMAGDMVFVVDGYEKCIVAASKGFAGRGVQACDNEPTVFGAKEAFSESLRTNTALVRRRVRDTGFKVEQLRVGKRGNSDIALLYIQDLVRSEVLEKVRARIKSINIDAVLDSGICEKYIETAERSVFPTVQTTERPDKTASAVLEGRIAVIVDNSPFALIVPSTFSTFFQSSEDYYQKKAVMAFTRVLRFAAAFVAICLPGFYVAATTFHPELIPELLAFKMAAARQNVPFPIFAEVLIMELAFELLQEAGIRLPGVVGGAIGVVGGLMVGQAAVEAGLVSPNVVIITAITGIAGFAVPNYKMAGAVRVVKYIILVFSAVFGFLGFAIAGLGVLSHLSNLSSYGMPYLFPFSAREISPAKDTFAPNIGNKNTIFAGKEF